MLCYFQKTAKGRVLDDNTTEPPHPKIVQNQSLSADNTVIENRKHSEGKTEI